MSETAYTKGPWFVAGTRRKMDGGHWHDVNRYDETKKRDENIACVGYDPRTGMGLTDARLIAAAPDLLENLKRVTEHLEAWAQGHSLESTCETMAALYCAHEAIRKAEVRS